MGGGAYYVGRAILLMKNLHTNTLQLEHLHLNADLSFLLKCTEFSIHFRK